MEFTREYFDQQISKLAAKSDLDVLATKSDLADVKSEVGSLALTLKNVKETVEKIDKRDKEDSNAFAKDIVQLQKDVKQLKLKPA